MVNIHVPHRWILLASGIAALSVSAVQPYRPVVVMGTSMAPTYHSLEVLVSKRVDRPLVVGDVIVFDSPTGPAIKRIAKVAGDTVTRWKSRSGWVELYDVSYDLQRNRPYKRIQVDRIPEGYVYVLGDNLQESLDSREYGWVPISKIHSIILDQRKQVAKKPDKMNAYGAHRSGSGGSTAGPRNPSS